MLSRIGSAARPLAVSTCLSTARLCASRSRAVTTALLPTRRNRVLRRMISVPARDHSGPPSGCRSRALEIRKSMTKRYFLAIFAERVGIHRRPASATASKEVVTGRSSVVR